MSTTMKDRVRETCTVAGTGSATLTGAVASFVAFSSGVTNYVIVGDNNEWEAGSGTATVGLTLTRDVIYGSSNAGAKVVFTAGNFEVFQSITSNEINGKLDRVGGTVTGVTQSIIALSGTVIDVSASNIFTQSISSNTTYTFSGFTSDYSSTTIELTVSGSPTVAFTGVTFKNTPVIQTGLNIFTFTSSDSGTTKNGFILLDGS